MLTLLRKSHLPGTNEKSMAYLIETHIKKGVAISSLA